MRLTMHSFAAGMLGAALLLTMSGCQRSDENVQAARETAADTGDRTKAVLNDSDRKFLKKAEEGDIKEQNLGRWMLERTQNKDVKDYAQMLVDDHSKDLRNLVDLMNQKGMPQPKDLPEVKHEAMAKLQDLSGTALDREFTMMMVEDHQKAARDFETNAKTAEDRELRTLLSKTLPTVREHLKHAQRLAEKLGADTNIGWTAFGPTNVLIHRMSAAVALEEPQAVLAAAVQIDVSVIPSTLRGRQAQFHLDSAWPHFQLNEDPLAVIHLLDAERVAPQLVHSYHTARDLIRDLLAREHRGQVPGLRGLAQRAGVLA